jgi:hypothetical protein
MLDTLGKVLRTGELEVPGVDAVRELSTFVLDDMGRPGAEIGCKDDRVISMGIAVQMMREHRHAMDNPLPEYQPVDEESLTG